MQPTPLVKSASAALAAAFVLAGIATLVWRATEDTREQRKALKMLPHLDVKEYNDLFLP